MNDLAARASRGFFFLLSRQALVHLFTFAGGIVLARTLAPVAFGLFAIATFLVHTIALFGDFGLAPSFVQRREELTEADVQVGFTLQQLLITLIVLVTWFAAPFLVALYPDAPSGTIWLVRVLTFQLYFNAWRSMSVLLLERKLVYGRLAVLEGFEALLYQGVAVVLALLGYGVWSFVWATVAKGVVGALLVYLIAPWRVRLRFDPAHAYQILRKGIPFQVQALVNQIGGWTTPVLVGLMIGPQAVGYLTWASSNGRKPLMLVDNLMRVAFPYFARLQQDDAALRSEVQRLIALLSVAAGLWWTVLLVCGVRLVEWIYTGTWLPAVPALILFASALIFELIGWVIAVTLNALGRVQVVTRIVLIRSLLTVALSAVLVWQVGYLGIPIANLVAQGLTVPWLLGAFGRGEGLRALRNFGWIAVAMAGGAAAGTAVSLIALAPGPAALLGAGVTSIAYGAVAWLMAPAAIRAAVQTYWRAGTGRRRRVA